MLNIDKYEKIIQLILPSGKTISVLDSFKHGSRIKEIFHREVVLYDRHNNIIDWVISIPNSPENEYFWRDNKQGDLDDYDRFSHVSIKDGKYHATTFQGLIFELNIQNGEAIFQYQTRG